MSRNWEKELHEAVREYNAARYKRDSLIREAAKSGEINRKTIALKTGLHITRIGQIARGES